MWFNQKVRMPLLFSYSIKKVQKNGLDFCQNAKTLILEPFLGRLGPDPSGRSFKNHVASLFLLYDFI